MCMQMHASFVYMHVNKIQNDDYIAKDVIIPRNAM